MGKKKTIGNKIVDLVDHYREENQQTCSQVHRAMLAMDITYYRSSLDYMKECEKNSREVCLAADDPRASVTPPLLLAQTETILAFISGSLVDRGDPFPVKYDPEITEEGKKLEDFLTASADQANVFVNSIQELKNVVKHNFGFHRVFWTSDSAVQKGTRTYALGVEGLRVDTLSGYYCLWDTQVQPKDFAREGMYFEHNQLMSERKAEYALRDIKESHTVLPEGSKVLENLKATTEYTATVKLIADLPSYTTSTEVTNNAYAHLLKGTDPIGKAVSITRINVRCKAKDIGLPKSGDRYNLYDIILVNGTPVAYKELDVPYMEFGITLGAVDDFGWLTRSVVEPLAMYQDVAASLLSARLTTLNRSVADRAIYNPLFIDPEDLKNAKEDSKIPIRRNRWLDDNALAKAYHRIPFEDNTSVNAVSEANFFMGQASDEATGISAFRKGPVRGNRSVGQFQAELEGSDGRGMLLVNTIDASRGVHIRSMLRALLLTYRPGDLDWDKLSSSISFGISSKLTKLGLLDDLNFIQQVLVAGAQGSGGEIEAISAQVLKYIIAQRSTLSLDDFTPEQEAQPQDPASLPNPNTQQEIPDGQPIPDGAVQRVDTGGTP